MRVFVLIFAFFAILISSGCAIIEKETTNRGGYLDYLLDEHWVKADSKGMRALRAFAIQVSLSRIASVSAKNDTDRQLLAIRLGALTQRFAPIYMCAFDTNPLGVSGAERDPCFYYDSAMVDYSTGLFDLAMIALPVDDAKRLITSVTGSIVSPINLVDLLDTLLAIGKDAIKYGRIVGALYRDTVELEVQVWLGTPAIDNRPLPFRVTEEQVAPLRAIYAARNDDMPAWLAAIAALRAQGLEPLPQPKFFAELGGLMNYICTLITKEKTALQQCQQQLPQTLPPAKPVLSAGTSVVVGSTIPMARALRESIPSSPHGALSGAGSGTDGSAGISGAKNKVESAIPLGDFQTIQGNLCASRTGRFDNETREAIRQAKAGGQQSAETTQPFTNLAGEIKSQAEVGILRGAGMGNCSQDRQGAERGYLTAFERFRFPDAAAIKILRDQLNNCDPSLKLKDDVTSLTPLRAAIAKVNSNSKELDDKSFKVISDCIPKPAQ
jgi:hypothetical protein